MPTIFLKDKLVSYEVLNTLYDRFYHQFHRIYLEESNNESLVAQIGASLPKESQYPNSTIIIALL